MLIKRVDFVVCGLISGSITNLGFRSDNKNYFNRRVQNAASLIERNAALVGVARSSFQDFKNRCMNHVQSNFSQNRWIAFQGGALGLISSAPYLFSEGFDFSVVLSLSVFCYLLSMFVYCFIQSCNERRIAESALFALSCKNTKNKGLAEELEGQSYSYFSMKKALVLRFAENYETNIPRIHQQISNLKTVVKIWGYCGMRPILGHVKYIAWMMSSYDEDYLRDQGIQDPTELLGDLIDELSNKTSSRVIHDEEKSRFFMVMGHKTHAIVCEFGRKQTGDCYFSIYNKGEGVERHGWSENEHECIAKFTVESLSLEALQDFVFLQGLVNSLKKSSTSDEIYKHVESCLIGRFRGSVAPITRQEIHRPQTHGTCLYSNSSLALRSVVTDRKLRKELKLFEIQGFLEVAGGSYLSSRYPELYSEVIKKMDRLSQEVQSCEQAFC